MKTPVERYDSLLLDIESYQDPAVRAVLELREDAVEAMCRMGNYDRSRDESDYETLWHEYTARHLEAQELLRQKGLMPPE